MADKELILKEKVEQTGVFDFAKLYSFAHTWLTNEGYGVAEEKYSEKNTGNTRNISVEWKATRGLSDYFKTEGKIKIEVKELADVEVEIDGKRIKSNKGELSIEFAGNLIKDPDNKWETSPFNRFMRDLYNKYVIPAKVDEMRGKVGDDVKKFKESIKEFLNIAARR